MKPFYRSKKFLYALATFLAAAVIAALPMVVALDDETVAMLEQMLPLVFVMGALVIAGHTVTDVMAVWREGVASTDLRQAAHELIEALAADQVDASDESGGQASGTLRAEDDSLERRAP